MYMDRTLKEDWLLAGHKAIFSETKAISEQSFC